MSCHAHQQVAAKEFIQLVKSHAPNKAHYKEVHFDAQSAKQGAVRLRLLLTYGLLLLLCLTKWGRISMEQLTKQLHSYAAGRCSVEDVMLTVLRLFRVRTVVAATCMVQCAHDCVMLHQHNRDVIEAFDKYLPVGFSMAAFVAANRRIDPRTGRICIPQERSDGSVGEPVPLARHRPPAQQLLPFPVFFLALAHVSVLACFHCCVSDLAGLCQHWRTEPTKQALEQGRVRAAALGWAEMGWTGLGWYSK